jgi:hypothetical protein
MNHHVPVLNGRPKGFWVGEIGPDAFIENHFGGDITRRSARGHGNMVALRPQKFGKPSAEIADASHEQESHDVPTLQE